VSGGYKNVTVLVNILNKSWNTVQELRDNYGFPWPQNIFSFTGNNCRLNDNVFLHGGGGIVIKDNVTISASAKLISYGYDTVDWINNCVHKKHVGKEIFIGKNTWIGAGVIVLPGVRINGVGVILAAGAVVTKSFDDDYVVIAGNPAQIIKNYK